MTSTHNPELQLQNPNPQTHLLVAAESGGAHTLHLHSKRKLTCKTRSSFALFFGLLGRAVLSGGGALCITVLHS